MRTCRIRGALAVGLLSVLACEPTPPDDPQPPAAVVFDICNEDGACALSFREVDVSTRARRTIRVTNPLDRALPLEYALSGATEFALELGPTPLRPGLSADIVLSVRPLQAGPIRGVLSVSDGEGTTEIDLSATGIDNGLPAAAFTPDCSFGSVAIGTAAHCLVVIDNGGALPLVIEGVGIVDGTAPGFSLISRPPEADEPVLPGASVEVLVRFAPEDGGAASGALQVRTNDPLHVVEDIPLTGTGVEGPTCSIAIESVRGAAYAGGPIAPGDEIVLSGAGSASADGTPLDAFLWTVTSRPARSGAGLDAPNDFTTSITSVGPDGTVGTGVDAPGLYCVGGQAQSALGAVSVNACELCFEARFSAELVVELTWDTPENDLDLHLTRRDAAGAFCVTSTSGDTPTGLLTTNCANGLDCNFASCQGGGLEWDGAAGITAGDPVIELDDINGFGPERTRVDQPIGGEILIGVNAYAGTSEYETPATVRVFVFGQLAASFDKELDVGAWWEVALVRWPAQPGDGPVCIEDLTDGAVWDECP